MVHNKRNLVKYKQDESQNEADTISVATNVQNADGTSQVENESIPTSRTFIEGADSRPGINRNTTPDTLANKKGDAIYLGFKCDINDGCNTSIYEKKVETPDRCAKVCLDIGANAGSYISLNSNACRNTDPFIPGNISYYPDNMLGTCICYSNAKYTPDTYINETYIDDYNLFRIG